MVPLVAQVLPATHPAPMLSQFPYGAIGWIGCVQYDGKPMPSMRHVMPSGHVSPFAQLRWHRLVPFPKMSPHETIASPVAAGTGQSHAVAQLRPHTAVWMSPPALVMMHDIASPQIATLSNVPSDVKQ